MSGYTHKTMMVNNMFNPFTGQSFNSGLGYHPHRMEGTGKKSDEKNIAYHEKQKIAISKIGDLSIAKLKLLIARYIDEGFSRQSIIQRLRDKMARLNPDFDVERIELYSFAIGGLFDDINIDIFKETKPQVANFYNSLLSNEYIIECEQVPASDENALSYLVRDLDLEHSDKIKLGHGVEKAIVHFVEQYGDKTGWVNIREANKKGFKETDHLFANHEKKLIIYAEVKSNIGLDTEKAPATSNKINDHYDNWISKTKNPNDDYYGYKVSSNLLATRYLSNTEIGKVIMDKYRNNTAKKPVNLGKDSNIVGINDYMKLFGFDIEFTQTEYTDFITYICIKMFKLERVYMDI